MVVEKIYLNFLLIVLIKRGANLASSKMMAWLLEIPAGHSNLILLIKSFQHIAIFFFHFTYKIMLSIIKFNENFSHYF